MMKNSVMQSFKKKFFNADGTLNKTVVASFITLLILLIQQIMAIFGVQYHGDWSQVVGAINTILALLSVSGFIEGNGTVEISNSKKSTGDKTDA